MCENAFFQELLTFNHYDYKRKSFTPEEIMDKEKELRDMLKPNTWEELKSMIWCVPVSKIVRSSGETISLLELSQLSNVWNRWRI